VDLSGRPYAVTQVKWNGTSVGGLPVSLFAHFFQSLAVTARANIHARVHYGRDDHHQAEALFKALGRALDAAVSLDPRRGQAIPSTKGAL
jgi:imidazoleglycerol-phosphate dehydratase